MNHFPHSPSEEGRQRERRAERTEASEPHYSRIHRGDGGRTNSRVVMGRLSEVVLVSFFIVFLLNTGSTWAKKGVSVRKPSISTNKGTSHSKPSHSQPGRQSPGRDPYPAGGSYPYPGNTNQGGHTRQNQPSYPGAGNYPQQNPGRVNPGGYPNQNPGGYPNQNPAGYPNQNPGGYPNRNPGYPNQNPGSYPNQNPAFPPGAGQPAGGYPNQYPGRAGYPNQYPGGYPNQYPGGFPAAGGFPGAGGYPIRTGTGQGWGAPAANPGGYGYPGGYPNWNPNNKILSPRFGGGGYGYGGYGMGGSPFSQSVQRMGYQPKSTGFAKKAMMAAGVGAVAGMAVGYGLGRFPRPHFTFRNPEEEYYYNNYMYRRYGTQSTDQKDYGRDYVYRPPPRAETYEKFMDRCMNRTDLLKDQRSGSTTPKSEGDKEDDDVVSIEEIGYPALIEQMKARRCVEEYMVESEKYLQERKAEQQFQPSRSSPLGYGVIQLSASLLMLLSSMLLLQ
ncbi:calcium-binding protein P-like isoform X2 [Salarias fasciatus]|uniref:calcium-binding protein P-like isoform X2 n=1 Tax=Salarias fasciatus TaxID=181472 RepID=UPI0011768334|nr:calcium-binding protein P-like isoform X2 [Salarias fasciatus]